MRAFAHAAPEHVLIRFKPNRYSRQGDSGSCLLVHEGAAATRKHTRAVAQQTRHDAALSVAERVLSVPRENFCDRHARRGFDLLIGIDEFEAKLLRETPAGRGLARSHESDEDNRAPPERRHERGHAPVTRAVRLCLGSRCAAAAHPVSVACRRAGFKRDFWASVCRAGRPAGIRCRRKTRPSQTVVLACVSGTSRCRARAKLWGPGSFADPGVATT